MYVADIVAKEMHSSRQDKFKGAAKVNSGIVLVSQSINWLLVEGLPDSLLTKLLVAIIFRFDILV